MEVGGTGTPEEQLGEGRGSHNWNGPPRSNRDGGDPQESEGWEGNGQHFPCPLGAWGAYCGPWLDPLPTETPSGHVGPEGVGGREGGGGEER